jgi:branched-chain amino acid transport system substrate-binding protein
VIHNAVLPWAERAGVAAIGPYGGEVSSRSRDHTSAFFLTANFSAEGERIAAHLTSLGRQQVAVVYMSDSDGKLALTALDESLSGRSGIGRVWTGTVRADGGNASAILAEMLAAKPDTLVLATRGPATIGLLRALQ